MADPNQPKKDTVRLTLAPRPDSSLAASRPARQETVRINLPSPPPARGVIHRQAGETEDGALRPGMAKIPVLAPSPSLDRIPSSIIPVRRPPMVPPTSISGENSNSSLRHSANDIASTTPEPAIVPTIRASSTIEPTSLARIHPDLPMRPVPKKETTRISRRSEPATTRLRLVEMSKTRPLLLRPNVPPPPVRALAAVTVAPAGTIDPFNSLPKSFCWGLFVISAVTCLIQIWSYFSS
jgi:hypothetical protein